MCLYYDEVRTEEFKKANKGGRTVTTYKVFKLASEAYLKSVYFQCFHRNGMIQSDREVQAPLKDIWDYDSDFSHEINRGIHVFLTKEAVGIFSNEDCDNVIVKVTCKMKDLVCVGEDNDAVFMKVFLTKKEYQKALKFCL